MMKKLMALLLIVVFILTLSGCSNIKDCPQNNLYEIKSITKNTQGVMFFDDVLEPFFEDENYVYLFSNPISEYVIVKYTNDTQEKIQDALKSKHINITDLDKYNIHYYSEPKFIENIIFHSELGGDPDALEVFYSDDIYYYTFPSIRSEVVIVYYKDGTKQTVKTALKEGKIKITDLDYFGIQYYKNPKNDE